MLFHAIFELNFGVAHLSCQNSSEIVSGDIVKLLLAAHLELLIGLFFLASCDIPGGINPPTGINGQGPANAAGTGVSFGDR